MGWVGIGSDWIGIGSILVKAGLIWESLVRVRPKARSVGLKGFRSFNYRYSLEPLKVFSYMIGMVYVFNFPKVQLPLDILSNTIFKPREGTDSGSSMPHLRVHSSNWAMYSFTVLVPCFYLCH